MSLCHTGCMWVCVFVEAWGIKYRMFSIFGWHLLFLSGRYRIVLHHCFQKCVLRMESVGHRTAYYFMRLDAKLSKPSWNTIKPQDFSLPQDCFTTVSLPQDCLEPFLWYRLSSHQQGHSFFRHPPPHTSHPTHSEDK